MTDARTDADRSPALDLTVDAGFAILLAVCTWRYFVYHPLEGTGILALVLAIGTGIAYGIAVARPLVRDTALAQQRVGILLATALWLPLTVLAPSFGWCAFALVFAVHRVLSTRTALIISTIIVVAVSLGLLIMSRGQDLGLVLGPFFGGLVLSYAYAALTQTIAAKRAVITELTDTRAQLARFEREAGALAERNRFASELHDTVVQRTASALLLLESVDQRGDRAEADGTVADAREALRETLVETRRLVHGLADPRTTGVTLTSALRAEADAAGAHFVISGTETDVPDPVVHALQRVTREALLNAAAHAQADTVRVTVTFFPTSIGVDIVDNGCGFDAENASEPVTEPRVDGGGYGLRAMRWRLRDLGGELAIESQLGQGTVIAASVPLQCTDEGTITP
ncbi:sensor histidine kinase [Leucobacter musarum]|uniref:sensor histidine kinase n=1 Tax=Leucobacter musarum TaxID=1930747 RepID=UPI0006A7B583|nr:sensor histidine kinase [Leucobacter musarum]